MIGSPSSAKHRTHQGVVRNPDPDGSALRILQHLWQLSGSRQDKCIRPGRQRLDQAVSPVIDPRIDADLRQVGTNQCEIVLLVRPADSVNSVDRLLVTNAATKRITGIRRVRDQSTVANYLDDFPDPMRLRIGRMNFDQFGHARIVGERNAHA